MTLFLLPLVVVTLGRVLYFAYSNHYWTQSIPNIAMLLNMLLIWVCTGLTFVLPYYNYSVLEKSKKQIITGYLLGGALN